MARIKHDPALIAFFAKGFDNHVEDAGSFAELDGAGFAEHLRAAGWQGTWTGLDDDEELDVADAVSTAWAECAEPHGDEDEDGDQQVSAAPHEVLDHLARIGVTFAQAS